MGIGLVDPILPAISHDLGATEARPCCCSPATCRHRRGDVLHHFVSSRIGAKRTLLGGLALIVVFAALAGPRTASA